MTYLWICRGCKSVAESTDREERPVCDVEVCERVGVQMGRDWQAEGATFGKVL